MKRTFLQLNYIAKKYLTAVLVFGYVFIQAQGQITINKRLLDNHDNISSKEIDKVLSTVQVNLEKYMQAVADLNSANTDLKKQRFESLFYKTANTKIYIDYRSDVEDLQYKKAYFADYYSDLYKAAPSGLGVNMLTARKKIGVSAISKLNDGYDCVIHIEKAFSEMVSNQREENEYILKKSPLSSSKSIGLLLKYRVAGDSALIYDVERAPLPDFPTNQPDWFVSVNGLSQLIEKPKTTWLTGPYPFELNPNIGIGGEINFGFSIRKLSISAGMGVITNSFDLKQDSNFVYRRMLTPGGDSTLTTVILRGISSKLTSNIFQIPISVGYRLFRSKDEKFSIQGRATFIPAITLKSQESNLSGSVEYRGWKNGFSVDTIKNYNTRDATDKTYTVHPINLSKTEAKFDKTISFNTCLGIDLKYAFSSKMSINFSPSYMFGITPFVKGKNVSTDLLLIDEDEVKKNGILPFTKEKGVLPFILKDISASGFCLKLGLEYRF